MLALLQELLPKRDFENYKNTKSIRVPCTRTWAHTKFCCSSRSYCRNALSKTIKTPKRSTNPVPASRPTPNFVAPAGFISEVCLQNLMMHQLRPVRHGPDSVCMCVYMCMCMCIAMVTSTCESDGGLGSLAKHPERVETRAKTNLETQLDGTVRQPRTILFRPSPEPGRPRGR